MAPVLEVKTKYEVKPWDRIPVILRAVSGFNSCLTVSVMSAVFIWSIHRGVTTGTTDWPGLVTWILMSIGPIIITLNFVNAKSVIATIVGTADPDPEQEIAHGVELPEQPPVTVNPTVGLVSQHDIAFEREIVGPTTVLLRAIAGTFSTHVICFCSLLFTWTIHDAMLSGHRLPGNPQLFMVVIGPIITSWNFVRANATLNAVIKGTNAFDIWRNKLASVLATTPK
jgi:hypothetical protein